MEVMPNESYGEWIVLSWGSEEALILLQPGRMLRRILESDPAWAERSRFLTRPDGGAGMLAVLPRAMGRAILAASAQHRTERELKEAIFGLLEEHERPPLKPISGGFTGFPVVEALSPQTPLTHSRESETF